MLVSYIPWFCLWCFLSPSFPSHHPICLYGHCGVCPSLVVVGLITGCCLFMSWTPSIFPCSWYSCWYFLRIIIFTQSSCSRGKSFCSIHLKTHLSFPPHNQIHALHHEFGIALMDGCLNTFPLYLGLWHGFFSLPTILILIVFWIASCDMLVMLLSWLVWFIVFSSCCYLSLSSLIRALSSIGLLWLILSWTISFIVLSLNSCRFLVVVCYPGFWLGFTFPVISLSFLWVDGLLISLYHHLSIKLQCSSSSICLETHILCLFVSFSITSSHRHLATLNRYCKGIWDVWLFAFNHYIFAFVAYLHPSAVTSFWSWLVHILVILLLLSCCHCPFKGIHVPVCPLYCVFDIGLSDWYCGGLF